MRGGDVIVADDDGIVVVPHREVGTTLDACRQRLAKESKKRERLSKKELGLDIENMRPALEQLGMRYFDTLEEAENS